MATITDLTNLKKRVDTARQDAAHAQGALEQGLSRLKSEHGCDTLEQAETKLKKIITQAKAAEEEFDKALKRFEAEHGAEL